MALKCGRFVLCGILLACGGDTDSGGSVVDGEGASDSLFGSNVGDVETCDPPGMSSCADEASVVRALVRPPLGYESYQGTLFLGLNHEWLSSGSQGGVYHISSSVPVDFSQGPASVELDMCQGGAMWNEDNCSFVLFAFLDLNDNATATGFLPDAGEPTGRVSDVELNCGTASSCLEIALDCVDGASCLAFADPGVCECDGPQVCESEFVTCS